VSSTYRPISLVAERAVRYVRQHDGSANSIDLAQGVMATRAPDEETARRVLEAAFGGDPRLAYRDGVWTEAEVAAASAERPAAPEKKTQEPEPDRTWLYVEGEQPAPGEPFTLTSISALRLRGDIVVGACGGTATPGPEADRMRRGILQVVDGAIPIMHDPPGAISAVERWLGEPLPATLSLRRLAHDRLGLSHGHDLEALAARLELPWREGEDLVELAETLDLCLLRLRKPGERLRSLQIEQNRGPTPIDWRRYGFDREFLLNVPPVPGTYRFYDIDDKLIYVGKAKNLSRRLGSYFPETGDEPTPRVKKLLDTLHRIEYELAGSDLEAMLREAEQIRRDRPAGNVQRIVHSRRGRAARLLSILILEPAEPPSVLRAYLIRDGRLVGRVGIGPRGGGLQRVERILEDYFFWAPVGPTTVPGPDLDVEVVARWLKTYRDDVVAFDPTDLGSSREVIERLRWFLDQGTPFDPDGSPVFRR
jgi:hypothetical protein